MNLVIMSVRGTNKNYTADFTVLSVVFVKN